MITLLSRIWLRFNERWKSGVLVNSSFIYYSLSSLLNSPSSILYLLYSVLHPLFSIPNPPSSIPYLLSSILSPTSSILYPPPSIFYPLSSVPYPPFSSPHPVLCKAIWGNEQAYLKLWSEVCIWTLVTWGRGSSGAVEELSTGCVSCLFGTSRFACCCPAVGVEWWWNSR